MAEYSGVFLDTCVLFDYALQRDDGTAKRLLQNHPISKVVSETVQSEFADVKQRREDIIESIYATEDVDNWEPPKSVDIYDNDVTWCAGLLSELSSVSSQRAVEKRLDIEERKINAAWDNLFEKTNSWVNLVWNGSVKPSLSGNLRMITNRSDKKIVGEAATWATDRREAFATSDRDDILSQKKEIENAISLDRNSGELDLMPPEELA